MKVLNDLYDYDLKIMQDNELFKFSLDSILLAEFVTKLKPNDLVLDMCTGNGVVPLILTKYFTSKIVGFEIQSYIAALACESVLLNKKEEQIKIIEADIHNIKNYFPGNNFDVVVANPPYFSYQQTSMINKNDAKAIARHEITLKLEDLFKIAKYSLKEKGIFYLVHLPERLEEILFFCKKYQIIAKQVQFVYTKNEGNAMMVLVKCIKGARSGLKVSPPLFIENYKSYQNIFRK